MRNEKEIRYTIAGISLVVGAISFWKILRQVERLKKARYILLKEEEEEKGSSGDTILSIISHFKNVKLDSSSTITKANQRRTQAYYQLSRDAHLYDLCLGKRKNLRKRREEEIERSMRYYDKMGATKSHRTVICMCDTETASILDQARDLIMGPLKVSTDIFTRGVWVPSLNWIPREHLHVTVACLWWWHTIRPNNSQLTQDILCRFRQALISEFHFPFQIELERIVLLGGKTLVALWRCIGERQTPDGFTIVDRHGESIDPFVKLRRDIIRCFTSHDFGEPLTHKWQKRNSMKNLSNNNNNNGNNDEMQQDDKQQPKKLERDHSIELKTPGMGNHDGFIHTTLARLPLDCLCENDVSLEPIHRLCREATATYAGHRMVINKFRFLETTGAGGESNPCVAPIFDETILSPTDRNNNPLSTATLSRDSVKAIPLTRLEDLFPGQNSKIVQSVKQQP